MASEVAAEAGRRLENAGFRVTEDDLNRISRYLVRDNRMRTPATSTEPWCLPATTRWQS